MEVKFYLVEVSDYTGFLGFKHFMSKEKALEFIQENSDGCTFFELFEARRIER